LTATELEWLSHGMAELERAIEAHEHDLAWALAEFIDRHALGRPALQRLMSATFLERAS
jgi:hypothetical protein